MLHKGIIWIRWPCLDCFERSNLQWHLTYKNQLIVRPTLFGRVLKHEHGHLTDLPTTLEVEQLDKLSKSELGLFRPKDWLKIEDDFTAIKLSCLTRCIRTLEIRPYFSPYFWMGHHQLGYQDISLVVQQGAEVKCLMAVPAGELAHGSRPQ